MDSPDHRADLAPVSDARRDTWSHERNRCGFELGERCRQVFDDLFGDHLPRGQVVEVLRRLDSRPRDVEDCVAPGTSSACPNVWNRGRRALRGDQELVVVKNSGPSGAPTKP